jgi:hypothetical protein
MDSLDEAVEMRLARLKMQTSAVGPSAGFEDKIWVLLGAAPANDAMSVVGRWGKFGVAVGALLAAASIVLALSTSGNVEKEEALAYGTSEYFE